nr:hypothetical protein [Tanacetum cinerariifolium]
MEKPVIIAISSCRVTTIYGGLQLTATPATYYYLNSIVPEATRMIEIYYFKVIINDGSAIMSLTCFSLEANALVSDCNEIVNNLEVKDPLLLPPQLKALEGTTHSFQLHFNKGSKLGNMELILDTVLAPQPLVIMPLNTDPTSTSYETNTLEPNITVNTMKSIRTEERINDVIRELAKDLIAKRGTTNAPNTILTTLLADATKTTLDSSSTTNIEKKSYQAWKGEGQVAETKNTARKTLFKDPPMPEENTNTKKPKQEK